MEGLFYLIARLLFKACLGMPFLFNLDKTSELALVHYGHEDSSKDFRGLSKRKQESGRQEHEMFIEYNQKEQL